jgi:hypothetical protein
LSSSFTTPQDPSYPVYVDSSVIMGMSGGHNGTGFDGIEYMLCSADNQFFPDLSKVRSGLLVCAWPGWHWQAIAGWLWLAGWLEGCGWLEGRGWLAVAGCGWLAGDSWLTGAGCVGGRV